MPGTPHSAKPSCSEARSGPELPQPFLDWCEDTQGNCAIELLTSGSYRSAHLTHLSVGEVVVDAGGAIRLALWAHARGAANLKETRRASLVAALPGGVFEIRLRLITSTDLADFPELTAFHLHVESVRDKSAPYAEIEQGLRFRLKDPEAAHARWARLHAALAACFDGMDGAAKSGRDIALNPSGPAPA